MSIMKWVKAVLQTVLSSFVDYRSIQDVLRQSTNRKEDQGSPHTKQY